MLKYFNLLDSVHVSSGHAPTSINQMVTYPSYDFDHSSAYLFCDRPKKPCVFMCCHTNHPRWVNSHTSLLLVFTNYPNDETSTLLICCEIWIMYGDLTTLEPVLRRSSISRRPFCEGILISWRTFSRWHVLSRRTRKSQIPFLYKERMQSMKMLEFKWSSSEELTWKDEKEEDLSLVFPELYSEGGDFNHHHLHPFFSSSLSFSNLFMKFFSLTFFPKESVFET